MYVCCACRAVRGQQTWAQVLSGQVLGPLYVLQDGANTSQLVAGHTVDPFVQDEESVPAAVLVAESELYRHSFTQRLIRSIYFYRTPSECWDMSPVHLSCSCGYNLCLQTPWM